MKPILLTVNRRLARTLKASFEGRVLSWDDFLLELFNLSRAESQLSQWRLSPLQERVLWANSMKDFPTLGFAHDQLMDCARDAYTLVKAYRLNPELMKGYKEDGDLFVTALACFESQCESLNAFPSASLIDVLLAHPVNHFPTNRLYCYGFDEWTPAQQAMILQWESRGVTIERMPQITRQGQAIKIIARDAKDEFAQAATYAKSACERGETVAIVVPQLQSQWHRVEQQLAEMFQPGFYFPGTAQLPRPYNISAGASLDKQPIIYALIETLNLLNNDISIQTWANILHTPYIAGGCKEATQRAAFGMELRNMESMYLSIGSVIAMAHIPELFKGQLEFVVKAKPLVHHRTMRGWVEWLNDWIVHWGFTKDRTLSSAEYQCVDTFHDVISQLYALDMLAGTYSFHEFYRELQGLLKNTLFQTETQDKPIQVLGMLEAAGLSFDHVWVVGLTADNNPAKAMPHPFIPTQLQIRHDMPHSTPERELRVAKRLLDRLIAGADKAIVSYASQDEKGEPQMESPLITSIPENDLSQRIPERMDTQIAMLREFQTYEDEMGLPLTNNALKGGSSVLKDQAACPHRGYLKHRLAAKLPHVPSLGISVREQGNLVHRVLENLWHRLQSRTGLMQLDEIALSSEIKRHVKQVLHTWNPPISETNQLIEAKRLHELIKAWLDYEKSRPDFTIASLERKIQITLNELTLSLTIDRVDAVGENQYLLIDYKTGDAAKSLWELPRMDQPQLPLYAAYMTPTPIGMAFARLKKNQMKLDGIIDDVEWEAMLNAFRHDLSLLADEIKSGNAAMQPKYAKNTCSTCDLEPGCRLHTGGAYER